MTRAAAGGSTAATGNPRRVGMLVAIGVAALSVGPTAIAVLTQRGWPNTSSDWMIAAAPVGVFLSVVAAAVRAEIGIAVLALTVMGPLPLAMSAFEDHTSVWLVACQVSIYLGICWVVYRLGSRDPPAWSAIWMAGFAVAIILGSGFDVPLLMLAIGWWLVGAIVRSRQIVATHLRARADELAAERERFAGEAVRLERAKIARELHDVVAHCMTLIVIQAQAGRQLLDDDPEQALEAIDAIVVCANEAEADIAALVDLMSPVRTRPLSRALLDDLVERAAATGSLVELRVIGDPDTLEPALSVAAQRAIQESLTNAMRHAPGARVDVTLDCGEPFRLSIENGSGLAPAPLAATGAGRGLEGLRERLAALGGWVGWGPTPDGGWRVSLVGPSSPVHPWHAPQVGSGVQQALATTPPASPSK